MTITVGTLIIPTTGVDPKLAAKGTTQDAIQDLVQGVVDQLGTAANEDASSFATAAQGDKADSAVQPGALGTAAAQAVEYFATADQGTKADTAVQPDALGTAAVAAVSDFATTEQGAKADTAVQPDALGTAAASAVGDFAAAANAATPERLVEILGNLDVKAAPFDADTLFVYDSVLTDVVQQITTISLWLYMKGKADALYQPVSSVLTATTASFTTTLKTKLDAIEAGATADQTGPEIATLYEAISGVERFTTTLKAKLGGIEAGAQANTVASVAGKTGAVTLMKADVGLGGVDNTADADKPISTPTATALSGKATTAQGALADSALQPADPATPHSSARWSQVISGSAASRTALGIGTSVNNAAFGPSLRLAAADIPASPGYVDIGPVQIVHVDVAEIVTIRAKLQRQVDPVDPLSATVQIYVQPLTGALGALTAQMAYGPVTPPTAADGDIEIAFTVSRTAGEDILLNPAAAAFGVFCRVYSDPGQIDLGPLTISHDAFTASDQATLTALDAANVKLTGDQSIAGAKTFATPPTLSADAVSGDQAVRLSQAQALIAALVDASPETLDTLNEIAAALGDDPNFSTTITTLIGTKLAKAQNLADLTDTTVARSNLGVTRADQPEAETGTVTNRSMTPSSTTQHFNFRVGAWLRGSGFLSAADTVAARAAIGATRATQVEAETGTEVNKVMAPATATQHYNFRVHSSFRDLLRTSTSSAALLNNLGTLTTVQIQAEFAAARIATAVANNTARIDAAAADARAQEAARTADTTTLQVAALLSRIQALEAASQQDTQMANYPISGSAGLTAVELIAAVTITRMQLANLSDTYTIGLGFGAAPANLGAADYTLPPGASLGPDFIVPSGTPVYIIADGTAAYSGGFSVAVNVPNPNWEAGLTSLYGLMGEIPGSGLWRAAYSKAYSRLRNVGIIGNGTAGAGGKARLLHLYTAHSGPASRQNWASTVKGTLVGTPTFTVGAGYDFNGVDEYIDTGVKLFGLSPQNVTAIVWPDETDQETGAAAAGDGGFIVEPNRSATEAAIKSIISTNTRDIPSIPYLGAMVGLTRTADEGFMALVEGGNDQYFIRDGLTTYIDRNIYVGATNSSVGVDDHYTGAIRAVYAGEALNAVQRTVIEATVKQFKIDALAAVAAEA